MTDNSEVIHLDEKRPPLSCDLRRVVCSQSAVCRLFVHLANYRDPAIRVPVLQSGFHFGCSNSIIGMLTKRTQHLLRCEGLTQRPE